MLWLTIFNTETEQESQLTFETENEEESDDIALEIGDLLERLAPGRFTVVGRDDTTDEEQE